MLIPLLLYAAIAFLAGLLVFWTGQLLWPRFGQKTSDPKPSTPPTSGQRFVVKGLLVVALAMGTLAWSLVYTAKKDQDKTNDWSSVSGLITTFDSQERVNDTQMSMVGDVTETAKEVVIIYTYQVGGEVYTNDQVHADERLPDGRRLLDPTDADELAEKYKVGESVTVYYDPDDPRQSALQKDENRGLYLVGLNAGFVFYFLAGMVTRWLVTQRK
ncbi:MAG: DUF3592 domain-containing protein [Anaerolineae bacterium]|nr:DUF3592 domain-containing protein [Anaerolineae bacterium]